MVTNTAGGHRITSYNVCYTKLLRGKFFRAMLEEGINLAPSQFEAGFMSAAHSTADLDKTIEAARRSFKSL